MIKMIENLCLMLKTNLTQVLSMLQSRLQPSMPWSPAVMEAAQRLNTSPCQRGTLPLIWTLIWTSAFFFLMFMSFPGLHVIKGRFSLLTWKLVDPLPRFGSWFYRLIYGVAFLVVIWSAGTYRKMIQNHDRRDDSNTTFCISSCVVLTAACITYFSMILKPFNSYS